MKVAQGNRINVTVERMLGGNYTCHDDTEPYLNHTLVLVQGILKKILAKTNVTGTLSQRGITQPFQSLI